jgi:hypothetical protein
MLIQPPSRNDLDAMDPRVPFGARRADPDGSALLDARNLCNARDGSGVPQRRAQAPVIEVQ